MRDVANDNGFTMTFKFQNTDISKRPKIAETSHLHAEAAPADATWIVVIDMQKARVFFERDGQLLFLKEFFPAQIGDEDLHSERNYKDIDGQRYRIIASRSAARRRASNFVSDLLAHLDVLKTVQFGKMVIVGEASVTEMAQAALPPELRERLIFGMTITPNLGWRETEFQIIQRLGQNAS